MIRTQYRKLTYRGVCPGNKLNCKPHAMKNIGLLLTKDDGDILKLWFSANSRYFNALVILDGSNEGAARDFFTSCHSVYYYHESTFPNLVYHSDGELRELGHKLVTDIFGYGVWITMAHTDEFYYHSPFKVIDSATADRADFVRWQALHVLPHPSEYSYYLKHKSRPITELFRHYYHFGPKKGAFLESRMFLNQPGLKWGKNQGALLPSNLKKELKLHPSYLHYKVHNLSLSTYTPQGVHKQHWNEVSDKGYSNPNSKRGVGIRWNVTHTRDFFVDHWPGSSKYDHCSIFLNDSIEQYLDIGSKFQDISGCVS